MSIPFQYREEACYRFIASGFKLEESVAWMMQAWKDDPTITRAKYPEILCANTVTMGGNGDQKQLNVAAFGNAYRRFASETESQLTEAAKVEVSKVAGENQSLRAELDQAQRALNQANNSIQGHLATINRLDRENVIYQLRAGETPAEPEGATV